MRTSVLTSVLAVALVVGAAACKGPDSLDPDTDSYVGAARGANVIPAAADTNPTGSATFSTVDGHFTFSVTAAPAGTLDSVALYQNAAGAALGTNATAVLCAGAAACATGTGTATIVAPATLLTIKSSLRGYGTQLVFFTTTAQKAAGGAMRGTMYPKPQ